STEFMNASLPMEMSLPAYKGENNAAALGVHVQIFDKNGKPVIGEIGDIVVSKPIPNLPIGLWNDKDGSVYREKYFSKYPGVFSMGDYGMINPVTKNWIVYCRRYDSFILQQL
ncbi:acetoacetyl-CoA synthetase, partial [Nephila pilipes]